MSYMITALLDDLFTRSEKAEDMIRAAPMPATGEALPLHWRIEWEERAAIMEYHGGMTRERAEAEAFVDIQQRMQTEHQEHAD